MGKALGILLVLGIGYVVYSWDDWGDNVALAELPAAAPWVASEPGEWPAIVLTNKASFRGHSPLEGGSAFLIEHGGKVYGATARHLLSPEATGVKPLIPIRKLDKVLIEWHMSPFDRPGREVSLSALHGEPGDYGDEDALFLSCKDGPDADLPATPLRVFKGKVLRGERVYLIGPTSTEGAAGQEVYRARVILVDRGSHNITALLEKPVDLMGFSGSPVVNEKGYVVGILAAAPIFSEDRQGRHRQFIAQGIRPLRSLWADP